MTRRKFGGRPLAELKKLRKNPADGGVFYVALLDAAPDLFQLAEDFSILEKYVRSIVLQIEKAANPSTGNDQRQKALQSLEASLDNPAIRKIIASK